MLGVNVVLERLVEEVIGDAQTDQQKTERILNWVHTQLNWVATDYTKKTVEEIIKNRAGNCAEMARVTYTLLTAVDIDCRWMAEVNLHPDSQLRQQTAAELVKSHGPTYSVFGLRHNDHRWIEVYNSTNDQWIPVDPTLNVIGLQEWVLARLGFEQRKTSHIISSADMIAPVAIFSIDENKKPVEKRSRHYLIDGFNSVYNQQLDKLAQWEEWKVQIIRMEDVVMKTFLGQENLHHYQDDLHRLHTLYQQMKEEVLLHVKK